MGMHISRHLKEEQKCTTDKQLWVISNYTTKELKIKAVLKFKTILDALLCMYYLVKYNFLFQAKIRILPLYIVTVHLVMFSTV